VRNPDVRLGQPIKIPTGDWIICGYGRMGKWLYKHFVMNGIKPVIIDPRAEQIEGAARVINSHANRETLETAGLEHAAGIVAGTDSDHDNLSILMSVQALKPDAFTIVRQNTHENQIAFDAIKTNLVLQSSLTTARRVLKHLISPQVQIFVDHLREQGEDICAQAVENLRSLIGDNPPHLWQAKICPQEACAVIEYLQAGNSLSLRELTRDPHNLKGSLPCMPFSIVRGENRIMLPTEDELLVAGDEILFCGTEHGERMLTASMNNAYTLDYLITGRDKPRGYLFRWLDNRFKRASVQP
jgi:Trk K+ transport system NAD-binding subunit